MQPVQHGGRLAEQARGVLPGLCPGPVQQHQPDHRAGRLGEQLAHVDEVAGRLGHLGPGVLDGAHMHLGAREGSDPGGRLGDRGLVRMVREGQVGPADQDVDRGTEDRGRHRGALDVPRRPAPAPRTRPGRVVGRGGLPQRHVPG